jgi:inosose dehydratase
LKKHQLVDAFCLCQHLIASRLVKLRNPLESVLAIADALKPAGYENYCYQSKSRFKWGSEENKSDAEQLAEQAENLDRLGAELKKRGMTLAYHTHDVELRAAAREFHHMLLATNPANVSLCLDVHWVYRGSGNSQVALFRHCEVVR